MIRTGFSTAFLGFRKWKVRRIMMIIQMPWWHQEPTRQNPTMRRYFAVSTLSQADMQGLYGPFALTLEFCCQSMPAAGLPDAAASDFTSASQMDQFSHQNNPK